MYFNIYIFMKKTKRKVAVFDIDGTIFRSSLLIEILDALIQEGVFPRSVIKDYAESYRNWINRVGTYEDYIHDVINTFNEHIKGVRYDRYFKVAKRVSDFHRNRVYRYTRDLVKKLKKKGYFLLAISHSPKELVHEFCHLMGFDKYYGWIYKVDEKGLLTGEQDLIILKKSTLFKRALRLNNLTLKGSVGVGDTKSDIPIFKMVEHPICFNPNQKLYEYAKRRGWPIVVERKDVVYHL